MERVLTLVEKLQVQIKNGEAIKNLLLTTKMMQTELVHLQNNEPESEDNSTIAVNLPSIYDRVTVEVDHKSEEIKAEKDETIEQPAKEEKAELTLEFAETSAEVMEEMKQDMLLEETHENSVAEETNEDVAYIPHEEDKVVSVLEVDDEEIEAELDEIKKNAKEIERLSVHTSTELLFDPIEDTPTLLHQKDNTASAIREINEVLSKPATGNLSHNDKLKEDKTEISHMLSEEPIKDLRKAIGVNDRFLFINELFRGDENMYERSIKTINSYNIAAEAIFWIKRELKLKLGWNDRDDTVKQFDNLVKRRFL